MRVNLVGAQVRNEIQLDDPTPETGPPAGLAVFEEGVVATQTTWLPSPEMTEPERVEMWRIQELVAAGYPVQAAITLAARADIDLHAACGLLAVGCDVVVAIDILL